MQAPPMGGVRVRKGDGETVRLPRGASLTDFAEKIGVDAASLVQVLFAPGRDGHRNPVGQRRDARRSSVTSSTTTIEVVSPEDEDKELLDSFNLEFGEDEGGEDRWSPVRPS